MKFENSELVILQTEFSSFLINLFYKSFVRMYELNLGENPWPKEMYLAVMSNVNISLVSLRIVF
jgi:hypothetical protein